MKPLTVLFPAIGGESTIAALAAIRADWCGDEPLRIVGCDTDSDKQALAGADEFLVSPSRDEPGYVEFLLNLCRSHAVDVLWPNPIEEQLLLGQHAHVFTSAGVRVLLPPLHATRILSNKALTYDYCAQQGMRVPRWKRVSDWQELNEAAESMGYPERPVVFRRASGRGGIGLRILCEDWCSFDEFFDRLSNGMKIPLGALRKPLDVPRAWPDCMVCEYLPGAEFDVDCFCIGGDLRVAAARRNDAMWWGTSSRAETVDRPDLVALCARLLRSLQWTYIASATFREDESGSAALLEVNCRMPASINLTWRAGNNLPLAALLHCLGRRLPQFRPPQSGVRLVRYFGESYRIPCLGAHCDSPGISRNGPSL